MKVRVIRGTYDYNAGAVVEMPQSQAESWIHAKLAEAYEEPVKKAKAAPKNKAKAAPKNKGRKKTK